MNVVLPGTFLSIIPSWWVGTMFHLVRTALIQYVLTAAEAVALGLVSETNSGCASDCAL